MYVAFVDKNHILQKSRGFSCRKTEFQAYVLHKLTLCNRYIVKYKSHTLEK